MGKYLSERQEATAAWLDANGIPARNVPLDADITIEDTPDGRTLRCEVFHLTADGHRQVDEHGQRIAIVFVTVPLRTEPPEWWQPHVKPTRDDLLDTVDKLRALTAEDRPGAAPGEQERGAGWGEAMRAVRNILDGKQPR